MKKILLGLFAVAAITASAQISSGQLFVGGALSLGTSGGSTETVAGTTTTTVDAPSVFRFTFMPEVGYMLNENIAIGTGIGYGYQSVTTTTTTGAGAGAVTTESKSTDGVFVFAPFARYYKEVGEKFYGFGEFALPIGIGSGTTTVKSGTVTNEVDKPSIFDMGVNLSVGINYFLSERFSLEAKWKFLGYDMRKESLETTVGTGNTAITTETTDKTNNIHFGLDFTSVSFGAKFFF